MYDTLFNKVDFETKGVVKKMFALKRPGDINMVSVQKQQGLKDCGVFAIAIMTSLAFDENPSCDVHNCKLTTVIIILHK